MEWVPCCLFLSLFPGFLGGVAWRKMLPGEITGIRDLLSRLEDDVVYSLADTATKRALAFTSVNGSFL